MNKTDKFWSKVIKTDGCWLWIGGKDAIGYGRICFNKTSMLAHRFSWWLHNDGMLPADLCVCHKCDVVACVNPSHLFLGTVADNTRDRNAKGRAPILIGENAGNVKLTEKQVRYIRKNFIKGIHYKFRGNAHLLAKKFNVGVTTIHKIVKRHSWKHLH